MANPTDDDRALARCYLSWPDAADRLAHTFAVIREEGQQASAAANTAEIERRRAAEASLEETARALERAGNRAEALAEKLRAAEALAERMWPIVEEVAGASEMVSRYGGMLPVSADNCRAAAALVREREEKETKP